MGRFNPLFLAWYTNVGIIVGIVVAAVVALVVLITVIRFYSSNTVISRYYRIFEIDWCYINSFSCYRNSNHYF